MNEEKNKQKQDIKQVFNQPYKYGFNTEIEREIFPSGINESIIELISKKFQHIYYQVFPF